MASALCSTRMPPIGTELTSHNVCYESVIGDNRT